MRNAAFPIAVLLFIPSASAQLTAGEVPAGATALELNLAITLGTFFTEDSIDLELDCDDMLDAWVWLHHGMPPVDAPNSAALHFVDDDIEVCADLATSWQQRPKYHAFGEALDCGGDFAWQPADELVLGDFGGFTASGPVSITDQYVAYRRGGTVGWIHLSFNLNEGTAVSLQLHRVLPICYTTTGVADSSPLPPVALVPNPSNGGPVRVEGADAIRSIELLDPAGRILARTSGSERLLQPPAMAGTYLVRLTHPDGHRSLHRLLRY